MTSENQVAPSTSHGQPEDFPLLEILRNGLSIVACLYFLGFMIWQAYLADYGVSMNSLLSVRYMSAAICYVGLMTIILLPLVVFERIYFFGEERTDHSDQASIGFGDIWSSAPVLLLFGYFPDARLSHLALLATLIGLLALGFTLKWSSRFIKCGRFKSLTNFPLWLTSPSILILLGILITREKIGDTFLIWTFVFLIGLLANVSVYRRFQGGQHGRGIKMATIFGSFCLLVIHLILFGKGPFRWIDPQLGGGYPEEVQMSIAPGYRTSLPWTAWMSASSPKGTNIPITLVHVDATDLTVTNLASGIHTNAMALPNMRDSDLKEFAVAAKLIIRMNDGVFFLLSANGTNTADHLRSIPNEAVSSIEFLPRPSFMGMHKR